MKSLRAYFLSFVFLSSQYAGAAPQKENFAQGLSRHLLAEGLIGLEAPATSKDLIAHMMKNGPRELVLAAAVQVMKTGNEELPKVSIVELGPDLVRLSFSGKKLVTVDLTKSGKAKFRGQTYDLQSEADFSKFLVQFSENSKDNMNLIGDRPSGEASLIPSSKLWQGLPLSERASYLLHIRGIYELTARILGSSSSQSAMDLNLRDRPSFSHLVTKLEAIAQIGFGSLSLAFTSMKTCFVAGQVFSVPAAKDCEDEFFKNSKYKGRGTEYQCGPMYFGARKNPLTFSSDPGDCAKNSLKTDREILAALEKNPSSISVGTTVKGVESHLATAKAIEQLKQMNIDDYAKQATEVCKKPEMANNEDCKALEQRLSALRGAMSLAETKLADAGLAYRDGKICRKMGFEKRPDGNPQGASMTAALSQASKDEYCPIDESIPKDLNKPKIAITDRPTVEETDKASPLRSLVDKCLSTAGIQFFCGISGGFLAGTLFFKIKDWISPKKKSESFVAPAMGVTAPSSTPAGR